MVMTDDLWCHDYICSYYHDNNSNDLHDLHRDYNHHPNYHHFNAHHCQHHGNQSDQICGTGAEPTKTSAETASERNKTPQWSKGFASNIYILIPQWSKGLNETILWQWNSFHTSSTFLRTMTLTSWIRQRQTLTRKARLSGWRNLEKLEKWNDILQKRACPFRHRDAGGVQQNFRQVHIKTLMQGWRKIFDLQKSIYLLCHHCPKEWMNLYWYFTPPIILQIPPTVQGRPGKHGPFTKEWLRKRLTKLQIHRNKLQSNIFSVTKSTQECLGRTSNGINPPVSESQNLTSLLSLAIWTLDNCI